MQRSMVKGSGINENLSTEYLLREYDELISCKSLGNYNCCEMISVFLWNRKERSAANIYTIFSFEERAAVEETSENVGSFKQITDKYSVGVQKKVFEVSKVRSIFEKLCTGRKKQVIDIGDGDLQVGHLEAVPKVFIQQDSTLEKVVNKVLKNNFRNGSYIIDFFDIDKTVLNIWTTQDFKKLTDIIYDKIPIDLFSLSDRMGNFVFQFPSLNVRTSYHTNETETSLAYHVAFREQCEEDDQFILMSEGVSDESTVAFGTQIFDSNGCDATFTVGDASRFCKTILVFIMNVPECYLRR